MGFEARQECSGRRRVAAHPGLAVSVRADTAQGVSQMTTHGKLSCRRVVERLWRVLTSAVRNPGCYFRETTSFRSSALVPLTVMFVQCTVYSLSLTLLTVTVALVTPETSVTTAGPLIVLSSTIL